MNNNSKKGIFSKKSIIIGISTFIVVLVVIIISVLSASNKSNSGNIICSFDYDYGFADAKINLDANYSDEIIQTMQTKIVYEVTDEILTQNMDLFEQKFKEALETSMSERTNLKFYRDENKFEVSYFIDYVNFNENDIKASEFVGFESENEIKEMTREELKTQVNKMNGSCTEVGSR